MARDLTKQERNELRKLRSLPNRTVDQTRRLIELSKKAQPFNAMPKQARK